MTHPLPLTLSDTDCDFDSDCAIGHVCYERNAGDSGNVPTCVGNANTIGFANDDYCIPRPRSNTLISVFENEADGGGIADGGIYPIPFCAGDCDDGESCNRFRVFFPTSIMSHPRDCVL